MSTDPSQLLQLLGSGIRPGALVDGAAGAARQVLGAGEAAFSQLLAQAQSGELSSHKLVSVDPDAGVQLTDEQIARLSVAADQAEAQGLRTALVVFDDKQVVLDVGARTVTSVADLAPRASNPAVGGLLSGVDGVINLSGKFAPPERASIIGVPGAAQGLSPSLAQLLEKLDAARTGRAASTTPASDLVNRLKAG